MSYIPWWQRMSPPTFTERFDLGGLAGRRVGFKYGGSWADWKTNFSDQMTFEEYLQMDLKTKKPHILDRKAKGGRIGFADVNVKTLNALFPDKDPTSTDFQPLDVPGAILPPLAIGAGVKYLKDKFFKKKDKIEKEKSVASDDKEPMPPKEEPPKDPIPEVVEDLVIQELIENYRKSKTKEGSTQPIMKNYEKIDMVTSVVDTFKNKYNRLPSYTELKNFFPKLSNLAEVIREGDIELGKATADYDRTDPEYIQVMETKAQGRATDGNTISIFGNKNFFPEKITLEDGSEVNAKEFFEKNYATRVEMGPNRLETKKATLNNVQLAKLFNTNQRKIEKAITILKQNPNFQADWPEPRSSTYGAAEANKLIKEARVYLRPLELKNVIDQENQLWELNKKFKDGTLVITDYPNLVKAINTTADKNTGILDHSIKKTDEEMIKRSQSNTGLFNTSHVIPKTSKQQNIEFLRNRTLSDYKTNQGLFKSMEAYIKHQIDKPDYEERLAGFDKYIKEIGLRVKIGNKFFGLDEKMFDSNTGEHTGINRTLEYYGLPKFKNGVPLKKEKMAEGGPVLFASGGLSGVDQYILNRYK